MAKLLDVSPNNLYAWLKVRRPQSELGFKMKHDKSENGYPENPCDGLLDDDRIDWAWSNKTYRRLLEESN